MKKIAALISVLLISLCTTSCNKAVSVDSGGGSPTNLQDYPVIVNDVTINAKPSKVIALTGNIADIILAEGYETSLKAVSEDCTQTEYNSLQKVSASDTNAIIELSPDVVISDSFTDDQISAFKQASITYVQVEKATSRETFEKMYSEIGSIMAGASTGYNKGISAAQSIFTSMDDLSRIIPASDKVTTACYLYDLDQHAATGESFVTTIMSYAGITNVFKGTTGGTYEKDDLKVSDPQFIFCPTGMKDKIMSDSSFSNLSAVKNGQVYEFDPKYADWEGRTIVLTATMYASIAYPELTETSSSTATVSSIDESGTSSDSSAASGTISSESSATESSYSELKAEDQNDDVMKMQQRLAELGYLSAEYDGYYGTATQEAVTAFQTNNGLTATGIASPETLQLLYSDSAKGMTNESSNT
jgi:ABC-type Fe3+-hydroxamate transport system substrate-binding protein